MPRSLSHSLSAGNWPFILYWQIKLQIQLEWWGVTQYFPYVTSIQGINKRVIFGFFHNVSHFPSAKSFSHTHPATVYQKEIGHWSCIDTSDCRFSRNDEGWPSIFHMWPLFGEWIDMWYLACSRMCHTGLWWRQITKNDKYWHYWFLLKWYVFRHCFRQ